MRTLNAILGGEIGDLPTIYLGMPLGVKSLPSELWNSVTEKCGKNWQDVTLSIYLGGGRLTLINSVLDSLPTYMMSVFPIPIGIISRLNKIRRKFLWKGNNERKRYNFSDSWKETREIGNQESENSD